MSLTVKELENLTSADIGKKLFDGDNLRGLVRMGKDGTISVLFRWRFRHNGKHHDYTCGTWRKGVSLANIRKERDTAASILAKGKNPNDERKLTKERATIEQKAELAHIESQKAALRTLESALQEWYGSKEISDRKDSGKDLKRAIAKDVLPKLKDVPVSEITKVMLADILHNVAKRAPIMANRLHASLNQFFKYAKDEREWIQKNPLDGTKRAKIGGKEEPRERILCDPINPDKHELKELREAMDNANLQDSTKAVLWVILATACRVGEITKARWTDINLDAGTWVIPAENSKNGKSHTVNLSPFALIHFKTLHEISGNKSAWVLPSSRGDSPVYIKSITKQVLDRQLETPLEHRTKATGTLKLSGGHWTPHDLRRTAATLMGHCGILSEIIERCLNHVEENKLKRIYQRQEPRTQMQEAWYLLGKRIETLLSDNIIVGNFGIKVA